MSKLSCLTLYENVAWFGFGLKHALFDLIDRDGGLECLTFCECLAESFNTFYEAQILHAFCRHQNMLFALLSGIRNWHNLIKPCAGIFVSFKFFNLIHGFVCLLRPPSSSGLGLHEATAPDALAQALIRLIQMSNKYVKNITIIGGIDCAWLAAFAEFVLGLRIEILTCDGAQEYCSNSQHASIGEQIQVTFFKDDAAKPGLEITRRSFILLVGQDLFKMQQETNTSSQNQMNLIRSPWASILIDSFGKSAQILLHDPVISGYFGKILVYASQENAEPWFISPRRKEKIKTKEKVHIKMQYCAFSRHGDYLLDFAALRFPELKPVLQAATSNREHRITLPMVDEAVQALTVACKCLQRTKIHFRDKEYCLIRVTGTIVKMISVLSMTNVHDINPIASGVRAFYRNESNRHLNQIRADAENAIEINETLRSTVHILFSSSTTLTDQTKMSPSAVAEGGICSFLGLLNDPKLPSILVATVTVMPGYIEYQGSMFEKIENLQLRSNSISVPIPVNLTSFELESRKTFDLLIFEIADLNTLQAAYRSQKNSLEIPCHFSVDKIIEELNRSDHLIQITKVSPMILGIDHEQSCFNQGKSISWVRTGEISLMIAILIRRMDNKPYIEIHKTSSDFSDPANIHQLYSKYQHLKEHVSDANLFVGFTYVSDCPAGVFQYFHSFESSEFWHTGNLCYYLRCVTIHGSGQEPRVKKFEFETDCGADGHADGQKNRNKDPFTNRPMMKSSNS